MKSPRKLSSDLLTLGLTLIGTCLVLSGCDPRRSETETASVDSASPASAADERTDKVPVTAASDEARALYTRGRDLSEHLRLHDARRVLEQALAKDSSFAMAHYELALAAPTPKESMRHLNQAVALSRDASEGERLAIMSLHAGANADPAKSREYAERLVAKYPRDERAHLTLGLAHLSQQQYDKAVDRFQQAIQVNPSYSPAYNLLGYSYWPMGNYGEAEKAFKKYIELVPEDPNPYDSYAELLMKTGRFDESIAQYRKALSIDPHFGNSRFGVASNLMLQGKHAQARAEAQKLSDAARDDGDRRTAGLIKALIYVDEGNIRMALPEMEKLYALGARSGDTAAMATDAIAIGDILLESGRADEARSRYQQALDLVERSSLSADVKEDARLAGHYDMGRVALRNQDVATARAEAAELMNGAKARQNDARIRQAHLLAGMTALQENDADRAVAELGQADQEDPYVLYTTALAHQAKGDAAKARELARRAATMYTLPTLNYALVRAKANQMT